MHRLIDFKVVHLLVVLVLVVISPLNAVNAQDTVPNPPIILGDGEQLLNPNPGIVAPGSTDPGARAVVGARGYGDAFFGWFLNNVSAYGGTWLDNGAPGAHNVCARIVSMIVAGTNVGGHSTSNCLSLSPGQAVSDGVTNYVACGSSVVANTVHSIQQSGYSWGPAPDSDTIASFCN